jgi:proline iminopeptidase
LTGVHPELEPYDQGSLDVGDGHRVHWETCGNPEGQPAVVLHGGPGSGCTPWHRRLFDPAEYRIVLFDQRNCGRSTPHASDPGADLSANTTAHLLADLERLREHLGVERWLVLGGSWGSVLGLAYAQRHPGRVTAMVLNGVFTNRRSELELLTRGLGGYFPEAYARFVAAAGGTTDVVPAYHRLLHDPDAAVRDRAARAWCDWEDAIAPTSPPAARFDDPRYRQAFVRIVTHYWRHDSFIEDGILLRDAGKLAGIPGAIVQGGLDTGNLTGAPWLLHHAWPGSTLEVVPTAGHTPSTPDIATRLIAATTRFAPLR